MTSTFKVFTLAAILIIASCLGWSQTLQEPTQPVNLIMDSDMAGNSDDVGDHALLWALSARGEVNVLALIISSTNDYSAPAAHAVATFYGHPKIPIGANKGTMPDTYSAYFSYYTQQVAQRFGVPGETRFNYTDAATVYRQALASAPDNSVYIVVGGFFRPLYDLLQTRGDSISRYTGLQLVQRKVKRLVLSTGHLPDAEQSPSGNLSSDPDAASYVLANWPGEVVWIGADEGWSVITGPLSNADENVNPVKYAYNLYCDYGVYCNSVTPAWTQVALLYAIRGGLGTNYSVGGRDGSSVVWDSSTSVPGRNIWSQYPNRSHSYLHRAISIEDMEAILNPLVQWAPSVVITQPPVANSQQVTLTGTSGVITLSASDPQHAPLTYTIDSPPIHGALTGTPPSLTYTANTGYVGTDSFTFHVNNGRYNSNTAVVTITIPSLNHVPVANSQSLTSRGESIAITLTATDQDNDALTYHIVTAPSHGTLGGLPPQLTYTPTAGFSGTDTFTFTASDLVSTSNVATVTISVTASTSTTLQPPTPPVNIILDSDLAGNADDVGDHAVLWALAARGEANVLALIISSNNPYSASAAHAIANYYGHPGILIGANKTGIPGAYNATNSYYTQQVTQQFGLPGDSRDNYPAAATAYRQALVGAANSSVYIVVGGYYRPLYDLLNSGPDAISPLTGLQLVQQKVKCLVLAAGHFPDSGSSPEGNLATDPDSASFVIANWPSEVVWLGADQGWNVITGPASDADPNTNPIKLAYNLYCSNGTYCANSTPAWTQLALLYAIRGGIGTNFSVGGRDGSTVVSDSTQPIPGRSIWYQSPDWGHAYLLRAISPDAMSAILNPLLQWIPPFTRRINAGGPALTDSNGVAWDADNSYDWGYVYSTTAPINTVGVDPRLFQTQHYASGAFQYTLTNLPNGTYTVNLYFAELYDGCFYAGCRVFDVLMQGNTFLHNFDVYAAAGAGNTGVVRSTIVSVTNSTLVIGFQGADGQYPIINALEIIRASSSEQFGSASGAVTRATNGAAIAGATVTLGTISVTTDSSGQYAFSSVPPGAYVVTVTASGYATATRSINIIGGANTTQNFTLTPVQFALRINSGGPTLTDSAGSVWQADTGYSGGYVFSTTATITAATGDPRLYQNLRYNSGTLQYNLTQIPNGTYTVRLYFAEIASNCFYTHCRVMNIYVQNAAVLTNFDIYGQAGGPNIGIVRTTTATVNNGTMNLRFDAVVGGYPVVNAIELIQQ
jgi:hypothetical protein